MIFSFLGDISLNDNYIELYKKGLNPFKSLDTILRSSDFVVGNLECMAKAGQNENELKRPRLTTTLETLNYLKNIHLSVACLAQNHVYDHLEEGFKKTTKFLEENSIKFLGASFEEKEVGTSIILKKAGIKIGILNYLKCDTNPDLPENARVYLNIFKIEKAINDIRILKPQVNQVVLILHWGGRVEGGYYPDWYQPKLARKLIDAGADLIIGHHSHTFQPFEKYKGKYIFYSLGNFCFSDYLFDGIFNPIPLRRRITSIVEISFEKESYKLDLRFFRNDNTSFSPLNKYIKTALWRNIIFKYLLRFKIPWSFYFLYQKYILRFILFIQRGDLSITVKINRIWKSMIKRVRII